jgi:hypothetical protein
MDMDLIMKRERNRMARYISVLGIGFRKEEGKWVKGF